MTHAINNKTILNINIDSVFCHIESLCFVWGTGSYACFDEDPKKPKMWGHKTMSSSKRSSSKQEKQDSGKRIEWTTAKRPTPIPRNIPSQTAAKHLCVCASRWTYHTHQRGTAQRKSTATRGNVALIRWQETSRSLFWIMTGKRKCIQSTCCKNSELYVR